MPTASPAGAGVDPAAVHAFVEKVSAAGLELHGFALARHGHLVARGWWQPYSPDQPHLLYSLSKTFTATAYALAEAEGLIGRDDPLIALWPEFAEVAGPRARTWTPRMLLRMASGHTSDAFDLGPGAPSPLGSDVDPVAWCFAQEPSAEPGSVFCYNQLCTYLVGAAVQKVTGGTLVGWLRPRLFDPLGIDRAHWLTDARGRDLGFSGLHTRLDAVLRLGLLYLGEGVWEGHRLLPQSWVAEARRPLSDTDVRGADGLMPNPDWACGYGYQLWRSRHGYRGDGAFGQFMLVLPEADAVVAIHSGEADMQAILDAVWAHLLPGLSGSASAAPSGDPLELTGLRLAPAGGAGPAASFVAPAPRYRDPAWSVPISAPVRALGVRADAGGWLLDLDLPGGTVTVPAGDRSWRPGGFAGSTGPVATRASAGWRDGIFHARIVLVTSPHTVLLRGDHATGHLDARWSVPPLHGDAPGDVGLPD